MFKRLLDEFRSSLEDDPDGSLWLVTALLTEANSLIESAEKKYKAMDFQAVNTVKTIVSVVLDTVIYPKGDSQQLQKEIHVVNHIAKSDKLVGALLLILQGHGRKSLNDAMCFCLMNVIYTQVSQSQLSVFSYHCH